MSTDIEICNLALGLLAEDEISSLSDTDRVSKACNTFFQVAVDWVAVQREWKHFIKRDTLTTPTTPDHGWEYAYALPSGHLLTLDVRADDVPDHYPNPMQWQQENGKILCNQATQVYMRYLFQETTETNIPNHIVTPIYTKLGSLLAVPVRQDKGLRDTLAQEAEQAVMAAAAVEGKQGRTEVPRATRLINARIRGARLFGPYV